MKKRARDYGIYIGDLPTGSKNSITDVKGVKVGHVTLDSGDIQTGVTAIIPHEGNIFEDKLLAASYVINGFGKSIGLMQVDELGTLETPIMLTNTLSVGTISNSLVTYMLEKNPSIGDTTGTVNPLVLECNDGAYLNDIRKRAVEEKDGLRALELASDLFEEGAVGAGRGMSCYQLKGGIGTASRLIKINEKDYTLGALVMSNHGLKDELIIDGHRIGKAICEIDKGMSSEPEKGSIVIVIGTDVPLTHHQLKRLIKRSVAGLSRTGSYIGNGSGDIVLGFSTANKIKHYSEDELQTVTSIHSSQINQCFHAVADAVEEAIINSLLAASTVIGKDGRERKALGDYIPALRERGLWK